MKSDQDALVEAFDEIRKMILMTALEEAHTGHPNPNFNLTESLRKLRDAFKEARAAIGDGTN